MLQNDKSLHSQFTPSSEIHRTFMNVCTLENGCALCKTHRFDMGFVCLHLPRWVNENILVGYFSGAAPKPKPRRNLNTYIYLYQIFRSIFRNKSPVSLISGQIEKHTTLATIYPYHGDGLFDTKHSPKLKIKPIFLWLRSFQWN